MLMTLDTLTYPDADHIDNLTLTSAFIWAGWTLHWCCRWDIDGYISTCMVFAACQKTMTSS